jgi:prepilin-type N-terminal cleavage/methylation domain-containing protein
MKRSVVSGQWSVEGRRAFTLIELVTVVAIMGAVAALALPAIGALTKDNSRAQAANQVRAYVSLARSLAIAQHRMVGVVFLEETGKYALPVHGGQTAMQLFAEDYEQAGYNCAAGNTVFVAYGPVREYLPAGIRVAALNDDAARGVMTGDEASATVGRTRAVLFDAQGRLITRHGLARPDLGTASAGAYPWAMGDWNFTTKRGNASLGMSSPGILLYDGMAYEAAHIAPDHSGDGARNAWLKGHANVVLVNANTGALLP